MSSSTTDRRLGITGAVAIKAPVRSYTTAAITLSGEQTVNGIALVTGDRCLVKNQLSSLDNGVYEVNTSSWTRSKDFDGTNDVITGTLVPAYDGTSAYVTFALSTVSPVIGTSNITFEQVFSNDASSVSFTQAGTGALARTTQEKLREVSLSLTDYTGWDNTGSTDQTSVLVKAMNKAFENATLTKNYIIDLPEGDFLFTQTNPFGSYSVSAAARQHVTFRCKGRYGARIIFRPGGSSDAHLYDGSTGAGLAAADNQLLMAMFEGFSFVLDDTGMSGGTLNIARLFPKSGAPNQNFMYRDCYAVGPSTAARSGKWLVVRGTINGSENYWDNCRSSLMGGIFDSTNSQAVNNYVHNSHWESMVGTVYKSVDGGGQLTHKGGSIIFHSALAADSYLMDLQASAGLTGNFVMENIKTELNHASAKLLNLSGANNGAVVDFVRTGHEVTSGTGSRTLVSVQPNCPARVKFTASKLNPTSGGPYLYEFKDGASFHYLGSQFSARIEFEDCDLPLDIHSRFSWGTNSNGLFRIRGGRNGSSWNTTDPNVAWDCDMLNGVGTATSPSSFSPQMKFKTGLIYYWPDSGNDTNGGSTRTKIPVGHTIDRVRLHRIAFGGTATTYRLAVTNDDGTFTYGVSAVATQNTVVDISCTDGTRVAASGVDQIIRVVCVKELAYNTQTANFTVGQTITDGTTATTAKILLDTDGGATGTLVIGFITGGTGAFGVGNIISDPLGGSATAGATTSRQGSSIARTQTAGDIYLIGYL